MQYGIQLWLKWKKLCSSSAELLRKLGTSDIPLPPKISHLGNLLLFSKLWHQSKCSVFLMWHANDTEAFLWGSFSLGESWQLHTNLCFISSESPSKCFGRDHLHIKSFCTCRPSAAVWTWNVSPASHVWTLHPHMVGPVWKVMKHLRGASSGYRL